MKLEWAWKLIAKHTWRQWLMEFIGIISTSYNRNTIFSPNDALFAQSRDSLHVNLMLLQYRQISWSEQDTTVSKSRGPQSRKILKSAILKYVKLQPTSIGLPLLEFELRNQSPSAIISLSFNRKHYIKRWLNSTWFSLFLFISHHANGIFFWKL